MIALLKITWDKCNFFINELICIVSICKKTIHKAARSDLSDLAASCHIYINSGNIISEPYRFLSAERQD